MINKRLFGQAINPIVSKKLKDRQRVAGEVVFGDSIQAVFPNKNEESQADLSSRTPFARMWTSVKLIDPIQIADALEEITEQEYNDVKNNQYFIDNPDNPSNIYYKIKPPKNKLCK